MIFVLLIFMAVSACIFGSLGWFLARNNAVYLVGPVASAIPLEKHHAFLFDLWAHSASYISGLIGGIFCMVHVWRARGREAKRGLVAPQ